MAVTIEMVKQLRELTGAGVLDCRNMLAETEGDLEEAAKRLREKGLAKAAKKAGRETNEGLIGHYVHPGSRVAGLIEVNCETDFVARTPEFQAFAHDMAMQVVASNPQYASIEDVPPEVVEQEKEVYRKQMEGENKPAQIIERIVEGKMRKFYEQVCLLEQPFIRDPDKKVGDLVKEMIATLGENVVLRRFARFEVGA